MSQQGEGNSVLVVEDDYLIALAAEAALGDAGFTLVGIATSMQEALDMAATRRPAIAVMDIHLVGPGDGVDAALELFSRHGIRCIFATAHADRGVVERAERARPLAWLQKPYSMTSLVVAVQEALRGLA